MRKIVWSTIIAICICGVAFAAQNGTKKKRPRPSEYGTVTIGNYTPASGLSPVMFDHWIHREKFTCRLCHVDIGFAMKAGGTQIKAADNIRGYFCGSCHNGRMVFDSRTVFASCSSNPAKEELAVCGKCHTETVSQKKEDAFYRLTERLPKGRLGNGIDWELAEEKGLIKPVDFLEGVSVRRSAMASQKDFALSAKVEGMPEIIFSHKKHAVWNGCELCHPELFLGVKKGSTKYSMVEIFGGKYCGTCHTSVAFPLTDCQRCHTGQPK